MRFISALLAVPVVAATSCSTPLGTGNCQSTSSCSTGYTVAGYCAGATDIQCCLDQACSAPQGQGICKSTSKCSGTSVPGYCGGPSGIQCCVEGSAPTSCNTPDGSGTCMSTSSCDGFSVAGYCPGGTSNQCCVKKSCSTSDGDGSCLNTSNGCSGGSFVAGACPGSSAVQCCVAGAPSDGGGGGGDDGSVLPGLTATQSERAHAIIDENNKEGLGRQGCEAAITTGLTESSLRILTNPTVPSSANYPNDGEGTDHDSIGIFQQRASIYTDIACDMDAACSASEFFKGMVAIDGWQSMDVATLCQEVQGSAVPSAYTKFTSQAASICAAAGV